jgi:hypothetical protein
VQAEQRILCRSPARRAAHGPDLPRLPVAAPHPPRGIARQHGHVGVDRQAQLPLQRGLVGGLAGLEVREGVVALDVDVRLGVPPGGRGGGGVGCVCQRGMSLEGGLLEEGRADTGRARQQGDCTAPAAPSKSRRSRPCTRREPTPSPTAEGHPSLTQPANRARPPRPRPAAAHSSSSIPLTTPDSTGERLPSRPSMPQPPR